MLKKYFFAFVISCHLLFLFGCAGEKRPDNLPKLFKTKIVVVQDGKPLEGASVVVVNTNYATSPWSAGGRTDAQGTVQLVTEGKYPGVPEGKYKVTVSKVEEPNIELPSETDSAEYQKKVKEIENNTFNLVEKNFGNISSTPLTIDVSSATDTHTLDVSPGVREKIQVSVN